MLWATYSHLGLIDSKYLYILAPEPWYLSPYCPALCARPTIPLKMLLQATAIKSQLYLHVATVKRLVRSENLCSSTW